MNRSLLALVLLGCGGPPTPPPSRPAPTPEVIPTVSEVPRPVAAPKPPTDPRVAADLASFDMMWTKINDTFWDPKAIEWDKVKSELRPKVEASKDREETRAIMREALHRLGRSHFALWTTSPEPENSKGDGDPGMEIRIIDGKAYVTRVEIGSPAEKAKIQLGDELVSVGANIVAEKVAKLDKELAGNSLAPLYEVRFVDSLLSGEIDSKVAFKLQRGTKTIPLELPRVLIGRMVTLGNLGAHPVIYEARMLDKDIAYIRLSIFLDPITVMPAIAKDLKTFAKAKGLILDLRGNPGGIGGMAMGITGDLVTASDKKLGTMTMKTNKLDFTVNPQVDHYDGKVAVLIDALSASTSEILAGGLQDLARGKIIGRTTAGAALPSVIELLPDGDRLQYAIADYQTASGKELEGHGVTPDIAVPLDLKVLRAGKDPDIVAATRWIKEKP
jgi:carboxyl-terminal processing protease